MAQFDEQILAVFSFIKEKRKQGRSVRELPCPGSPDDRLKGLPVCYTPGNPPFVVLKEDTFVELGNPLQGSASMVLWARQPEPIRDDLITIIGPDIPEAAEQSLPFGQAILVGASQLKKQDFPRLERTRNLYPLLEGYMIRHVPRKLWSRVSRQAANKGFSFGVLGQALMAHYRKEFPLVERIEILFVTSSKEDVEELEQIARKARGKSLLLRKLTRAQNGAYECDELDCDTCSEKSTCDTIKEVLVIRKKGKVTGIQIVKNTDSERPNRIAQQNVSRTGGRRRTRTGNEQGTGERLVPQRRGPHGRRGSA